MRVFRLDAVHPDGDGAVTWFYQQSSQALAVANHVRASGWLADFYDDDVPIGVAGALCLCGPWPVAPTDALVQRVLHPGPKEEPCPA